MLYLAETQRKSGFIGSGKAEFKLLACQRAEHDWSAVPGEEVVAAPDDADYGADTLVMLELNSNRQVQRHQAAGRTLVNILQNFSGLSKKFKAQGDEIEQWKESLTYQSQALNRREMEIETRQEQVEQAEADLAQLEEKQQVLESQQSEVTSLKEELDRRNSELEGAWAHLNGEIQRFEEQKDDMKGGLSDEQAQEIQDAIARLSEVTVSATSAGDDLATAFELVAYYQQEVAENRQVLEQRRSELGNGQNALSAEQVALSAAKQSLQSAEADLHTTQAALQQHHALQEAKQTQNQLLTEQLENQTNLHQQMYKLLNASDKVRLSKKVDVAALEAMSVDELQTLVARLEKDLSKMSGFVNDQEEELRLQQEDIDAIQTKIDSADEYDRLQLETEIEEEKDRHVMLNRTLVGQRRNLLEREEVLEQHRAVLLRKQGLSTEGVAGAAELEPLLNEIDSIRESLGKQIQRVEAESAQIQADLDNLKQARQQQQETVESHKQAVSTAQANCCTHQSAIGQAQGQIELYEALLPAIDERLGSFYLKLEAISQTIERLQAAEAQQQSVIAETRTLVNAINAPEPALV